MNLKQARISELLDTLADICLEHDVQLQEEQTKSPMFSDEDVMNITVCFNTIIGNRFSHKLLGNVDIDKALELSNEFGESLHERVLVSTDVNTKTYYNK